MVERQASVDPREVEQFAKLAARWWDPRGPMAPLHKLNPVRLTYIRDNAAERYGRDAKKFGCLKGLRILDIGCGAGILTEPLAKLGAEMTGIDPAEENIAAARAHAVESGAIVDYRDSTAETLAEAGEQFDVVLAMEVVEHVIDVPAFVATCASLVKPGGLFFAATLNRTLKSFALAIVGAEYVLRWLPRGTHQWDKFVTPDELARHLANNKLTITEQAGVVYNPLADRWSISSDMDVNYMVVAEGM
jgi:2-polyprenyl-6-hydroxyphenyl methylase/3-demethylubiquinone-9 3-methyltransferase